MCPVTSVSKVSIEGGGDSYEAPEVFPIGHLHDLLAGGGTQNCDAGSLEPNNGSEAETAPGECP